MGILEGYNSEPQQEAEQPRNYFDPLVNPNLIPQDMNQEFYRFMLESSDMLEQLEMQLKGYVRKPQDDGTFKYEKEFEPWLNDLGISRVKYITWSLGINKNTLLGNLSEEQINYKCGMLKKKLARLLFTNCEEYGVEENNKDLLIMTVVNTVHSGLSRCEGGKFAEEVTRMIQRHEIQHQDVGKEDKGFSLNPFNRLTGKR